MKIYLALQVFEDDPSWWDAHHMLGAYLTPELALAAHQKESDDNHFRSRFEEKETLYLGSNPDDESYGAEVLDRNTEAEPWRFVIGVELEVPESFTAALRTLILAGIDAPY